MVGNKGRGNKKVWNREEQVWREEERVESSQATPSSKPSQSERGTFYLRALSRCVVQYGLVCSALKEATTSQKTKSSISLFQNSFVKA